MTQCARVLAVLSDLLWHSIEDIHLQAGTMRLNSRVAELRSCGYQIECDKTGGRYRYRLTGRPSGSLDGGYAHIAAAYPPSSALADRDAVGDAAGSGSAPGFEGEPERVSRSASAPTQLSLIDQPRELWA